MVGNVYQARQTQSDVATLAWGVVPHDRLDNRLRKAPQSEQVSAHAGMVLLHAERDLGPPLFGLARLNRWCTHGEHQLAHVVQHSTQEGRIRQPQTALLK